MPKYSYFSATLFSSLFVWVLASTAARGASSKSSHPSPPSSLSCTFVTEELPTMCSEYGSLKADEEKGAKEACEKRGEQGAHWKTTACPSEGRVGKCQLAANSSRQLPSIQVFYAPGFNAEAAKIMCENGSKGQFLGP